MKARIIAYALLTVILGFLPPADAQQPEKVARIGYLDPSTFSNSAALLELFRREMAKLGWIERKNVIFESRSKKPRVCLNLRS